MRMQEGRLKDTIRSVYFVLPNSSSSQMVAHHTLSRKSWSIRFAVSHGTAIHCVASLQLTVMTFR